MTTKLPRQTPHPDFEPGTNAYWRNGELMVEIAPGNFAREETARSLGIVPSRKAVVRASADRP